MPIMAMAGITKDSIVRRRWAALVAVFTLVVQILMPLSQSRAAWVEEGLFPPTCAFHAVDDEGTTDQTGTAPDHCPLCQLTASVALQAPAWVLPVVWPETTVLALATAPETPLQSVCLPSSPPRGPPSRA